MTWAYVFDIEPQVDSVGNNVYYWISLALKISF